MTRRSLEAGFAEFLRLDRGLFVSRIRFAMRISLESGVSRLYRFGETAHSAEQGLKIGYNVHGLPTHFDRAQYGIRELTQCGTALRAVKGEATSIGKPRFRRSTRSQTQPAARSLPLDQLLGNVERNTVARINTKRIT